MKDVDANVYADEVSKGERAHRVGHAQPEDLVDGFRSGNAFHYGVGGFVDKGHEDAIGDEAQRVVDFDRSLAELKSKVANGCEGGFAGCHAPDDFDERHDGDGVEEVHADDLLRSSGEGGEPGYRDR